MCFGAKIQIADYKSFKSKSANLRLLELIETSRVEDSLRYLDTNEIANDNLSFLARKFKFSQKSRITEETKTYLACKFKEMKIPLEVQGESKYFRAI